MRFNLPFMFNILLGSVLGDEGSSPYMAGAMLGWPGNNGSIRYIHGKFEVPVVDGSDGSAVLITAGIGVGLGDGCDNLLQVGVESVVRNKKVQSNRPWYQWTPQPSRDIRGVPISVGDAILLGVRLSSDLVSGTFFIYNLDTQQHAFRTVVGTRLACTKNAGWLAARAENTILSGFTPVKFTETVAFGPEIEQYGPLDAQKVEMIKSWWASADILANVSVDENTVTIQQNKG